MKDTNLRIHKNTHWILSILLTALLMASMIVPGSPVIGSAYIFVGIVLSLAMYTSSFFAADLIWLLAGREKTANTEIYFALKILQWILLEGSGLLAIIFYIFSANLIFLLPVGLALITLVLSGPSIKDFEKLFEKRN